MIKIMALGDLLQAYPGLTLVEFRNVFQALSRIGSLLVQTGEM
jgi:hypothetical protein